MDKDNTLFVCPHVSRRTVVSGAVAFAALAGTPVRAQDDPTSLPPQVGDFLIPATGEAKDPLTPDHIQINGRPMEAWPVDPATMTPRDGTVFNLLMLSRWDENIIGPASKPQSVKGCVAQTSICTHAACTVSDYVAEYGIIECPCHFSRFDPRNSGAVIQGPAARKLPAIGLGLGSDGRLVVASQFDSRVGGDVTE